MNAESARERRRAAVFSSRAWSFIAARSSAVNPSYASPSVPLMAGLPLAGS